MYYIDTNLLIIIFLIRGFHTNTKKISITCNKLQKLVTNCRSLNQFLNAKKAVKFDENPIPIIMNRRNVIPNLKEFIVKINWKLLCERYIFSRDELPSFIFF